MSNERTRGIAPFFVDWLRERTRRVAGALRGDALTWDEIVDRHGPQAAAVLYVILTLAHGRPRFNALIGDVVDLLDVDRPRFNEIVAVLVQRKIIAATTWSSGETTWEILRVPEGWAG